MHPSGHLLSAASASLIGYAASDSLSFSFGLLLGGFLIDLDHLFDYFVFEGQRSLSPSRFFRYYLGLRCQRVVLFLHSYELMTLLFLAALALKSALLFGYLAGAALHLALDVIFNGQHALKRPILFYSFLYRWRQGFAAGRLFRSAG